MAYTHNPNLPKVRAQAVKMVRSGVSTRAVARHFGFSQSAVVKWCKKVPPHYYNYRVIRTESSRPHHHPAALPPEVVRRILAYRRESRRGAEFIHFMLQREGVAVSLASVKRTLSRHGLTKYSKWKKWHRYAPRPLPTGPGLLVEADTVHMGAPEERIYLYTLIDVYSRWTYATAALKISAHGGAVFVRAAASSAPFTFTTVQTDHGPEFSTWFTKKLQEDSINHRHSRVRTPNDNAHIERFNRTIQEECIARLPWNLAAWEKALPDYLHYYNYERPHMGINWNTPIQMLDEVIPRS